MVLMLVMYEFMAGMVQHGSKRGGTLMEKQRMINQAILLVCLIRIPYLLALNLIMEMVQVQVMLEFTVGMVRHGLRKG